MSRVFVLTCLIAAIAAPLTAAPNPPETDILEARVPGFSVRDETRVNALIQFARNNRIPLGIEVSDSELDHRVNISIPSTTARQGIRAILGDSRNYVVASFQGIVSIRLGGVPPPRWLDTTIAHYPIPRTTIAIASANLSMVLEQQLDPARQGFAGTFPPGDSADLIGPLDIRGATVRVLLAHLLRGSPQSSWIVTRPGMALDQPAAINRFWTIMYRAGSRR